MSTNENPQDTSGFAPIPTTRPLRRVPRTGARHFAATFTAGGGLLFCLFVIGLFSPTPTRHVGWVVAIVVGPMLALALLRQTPRFQLWWRRAQPHVARHLTIWQRRRRFWARKKTPPLDPTPAVPPPDPEDDPESLFVPSRRRYE